jgi:hypothetical protein
MAAFALLLAGLALGSHYENLGVARDADAGAIRAAFRRIALRDHPDKQPQSATASARAKAERRFQMANEAFDVLSDPAHRREYDDSLDRPVPAGVGDAAVGRGAAAPRPPRPPRPRVEVVTRATLAQMAGWEAAVIPAEVWSAALGADVTRQAADRLGLPLRLYLPPGTAEGDVVRGGGGDGEGKGEEGWRERDSPSRHLALVRKAERSLRRRRPRMAGADLVSSPHMHQAASSECIP